MFDFRNTKSICLTPFFVFWFTSLSADEPITVDVSVSDWTAGSKIWVGVLDESQDSTTVQWKLEQTNEFVVEIAESNRQSLPKLLFLKKNSAPVVIPLRAESISSGVAVKFDAGVSLVGTVARKSHGTPVTSGTVSIAFEKEFEIPLPEPSWFSRAIEPDGYYEVRGLPVGTFVVTASSQGFMPVKETVKVSEVAEQQDFNLQLTKAAYIHGSIIDERGFSIQGVIDALASPEDSQTTPVGIEFNDHNQFRIGPFAEDASIELTARKADGRRSRPLELTDFGEPVELQLLYWVQFQAKVRNHETGEVIEKFRLMISVQGQRSRHVEYIAPNGELNVEIDDLASVVSIYSEGFLLWTSGTINLQGKSLIDYGVIELTPARTLRGVVRDRSTRKPIAGASLRRLELEDYYSRNWYYNAVDTHTNDEGEFELQGFPSYGGVVQVNVQGYQRAYHSFENVEHDAEIELDPSGSISGQIVSDTGGPTAGRVFLERGMSGMGVPTEDGNFHFEVNDGTVGLYAETDAGWSSKKSVTIQNGESITGVQLEINTVGKVLGTIQGLADGETVSISIDHDSPWPPPASTRVESNGPFEVRGIPVGEHPILAITNRNRIFKSVVTIDLSNEARCDLNFTGDYAIEGIVRTGDQPMAAVVVLAVMKNNIRRMDDILPLTQELFDLSQTHEWDLQNGEIYGVEVRTTTDQDGSYRLEGLIEGTYRVKVPAHNFDEEILVDTDTKLNIPLRLSSLAGHVRASGSVQGARVRLQGTSIVARDISLRTSVDASGAYQFMGIPTGKYTITVTHPEFEDASQSVSLDSKKSDYDIYLEQVTKQ
ncbi:MAG: carboxypeptidase-like regulatory domain-containing protein [Gammaproteobacteria bacterium]|nr:carboxypeptidase-like regulatory domain-containing protein [Gammaproteobacteria bacterium]